MSLANEYSGDEETINDFVPAKQKIPVVNNTERSSSEMSDSTLSEVSELAGTSGVPRQVTLGLLVKENEQKNVGSRQKEKQKLNIQFIAQQYNQFKSHVTKQLKHQIEMEDVVSTLIKFLSSKDECIWGSLFGGSGTKKSSESGFSEHLWGDLKAANKNPKYLSWFARTGQTSYGLARQFTDYHCYSYFRTAAFNPVTLAMCQKLLDAKYPTIEEAPLLVTVVSRDNYEKVVEGKYAHVWATKIHLPNELRDHFPYALREDDEPEPSDIRHATNHANESVNTPENETMKKLERIDKTLKALQDRRTRMVKDIKQIDKDIGKFKHQKRKLRYLKEEQKGRNQALEKMVGVLGPGMEGIQKLNLFADLLVGVNEGKVKKKEFFKTTKKAIKKRSSKVLTPVNSPSRNSANSADESTPHNNQSPSGLSSSLNSESDSTKDSDTSEDDGKKDQSGKKSGVGDSSIVEDSDGTTDGLSGKGGSRSDDDDSDDENTVKTGSNANDADNEVQKDNAKDNGRNGAEDENPIEINAMENLIDHDNAKNADEKVNDELIVPPCISVSNAHTCSPDPNLIVSIPAEGTIRTNDVPQSKPLFEEVLAASDQAPSRKKTFVLKKDLPLNSATVPRPQKMMLKLTPPHVDTPKGTKNSSTQQQQCITMSAKAQKKMQIFERSEQHMKEQLDRHRQIQQKEEEARRLALVEVVQRKSNKEKVNGAQEQKETDKAVEEEKESDGQSSVDQKETGSNSDGEEKQKKKNRKKRKHRHEHGDRKGHKKRKRERREKRKESEEARK